MRRALPPGGEPPEDYVFERTAAHGRPEQVRLSELFEGRHSIVLYSYMYGPERDVPCNGCTHMLDAIDGDARHANQLLPLYVVSSSPLAPLRALGWNSRWSFSNFLSATGKSVSRHFLATHHPSPQPKQT